MTNKQRLIGLLGFTPQNNTVDAELIDVDIDGAATYVYNAANLIALKKCAINILQVALSMANTNDGLSNFQINWRPGDLQDYINILKEQVGDTSGRPSIKGVCRW